MKCNAKVILYFRTHKALPFFYELFILVGHNKICHMALEVFPNSPLWGKACGIWGFGTWRADLGIRHNHPQIARLWISRGGHPLADDSLRDASEKPCLYGYHQGKENLYHCGHHQGTGLFHPQHGRSEEKYEVEGTTIYQLTLKM